MGLSVPNDAAPLVVSPPPFFARAGSIVEAVSTRLRDAGAVGDGAPVGADELTVVAFVVGTAGNLLKGVPQFVRTAVSGRVEGLSTGAVWIAAVANLLWACFGVAIGDRALLALSLLGLLLTASTTARYVARTGWHRQRGWAAGAAVAAALFPALAAAGQDQVLALAGVVLGLTVSLPQLVHLARLRGTGHDVSGVSGIEYAVVVTAQVAWTTYWLLSGQWLVAAGAAWGGVARAGTLALLRHRARSTRETIAAPDG